MWAKDRTPSPRPALKCVSGRGDGVGVIDLGMEEGYTVARYVVEDGEGAEAAGYVHRLHQGCTSEADGLVEVGLEVVNRNRDGGRVRGHSLGVFEHSAADAIRFLIDHAVVGLLDEVYLPTEHPGVEVFERLHVGAADLEVDDGRAVALGGHLAVSSAAG